MADLYRLVEDGEALYAQEWTDAKVLSELSEKLGVPEAELYVDNVHEQIERMVVTITIACPRVDS